MSPSDSKFPADLQEKETDDASFVTEGLARMNPWIHRLLVLWFVALGITSIFFLFDLWPSSQSLSSAAPSSADTTGTTITSIVSDAAPDSLRESSYRRWTTSLNDEQIFYIIALFAGILGGSAHGLSSLMDFRGSRRLFRSWTLWYFGLPVLGGMMAVIFYIAVRAGLISGSADANVFSPFGIAAISSLVGLFTDMATTKLAEVFKTIFATRGPQREGQLNPDDAKKKGNK